MEKTNTATMVFAKVSYSYYYDNLCTLLILLHNYLYRIFYYLGICLVDEECGSNEKCFNGQCVNPCLMEKACGLNAYCRIDNHVVQCSCPQSFTGNQDVECVRSKSN